MAKITSLVELTDIVGDDLLTVIDKSDTTMSDGGSNKKLKASNLSKWLLGVFYPVGSIYETTSSNLDTVDKMNAYFGGTWEVFGAGRVLVAKSADTEFDTIGETGGAKTHTLTIAEMPSHSHTIPSIGKTETWEAPNFAVDYQYTSKATVSAYTNSAGGGGAHNNLQPYIVVFRYRRTA